jgi:hypothetical protein
MRYKIYLILFIIYLSGLQPASAQDERYRIELLVLRHLNGVAELEPQAILRDFSAAMDLLQPAAEPPDQEPPNADRPVTEAIAEAQPSLEETADALHEEIAEETEVEPQVVLLETQSEIMQRAWQRLRSSSGYRPELYLSWEQPEEEPFPLIRVHDEDVLVEDDPYADLRAENAAEEGLTFTDTTTPVAGLIDEDNDGTVEPTELIPQPIRYYRIDGTATLRRTRFLHLDLDLEYRERLFTDGEQGNTNEALDTKDEERARPSAFLVHTLQQNRQVQTQDMEYFDGPVFAVLAMISRVEAASELNTQDDMDTE